MKSHCLKAANVGRLGCLENVRKFNKFANYLADEARKISLYYFKRKIKIISKQDKYFDPVTIADITIQQKLHALIEKQYPAHSMIGEEEQHTLELKAMLKDFG